MKYLISLLLAGLLAYGAWPYYQVYRLDDVLGNDDLRGLSELVDLESIRKNTGQRFSSGVKQLTPGASQSEALAWLNEQLKRLGDAALEQAISLQWVMDTLRQAATRHSVRPTPYFISAIDWAFFDALDGFLIRLGPIGESPVHVRMSLQDRNWRVTDIIQ